MNVRKTVMISAAALGLLAGSAGIASAVSSGSAPPPDAPAGDEDDVQDPMLDGSIQAPEVEGQSETEESAALESLATVSADEASAAALAANPGGSVLGVELENENGSVVYEVEMTDAAGQALEVKVDAGNAAILHQESDADEADEADEAEDDGVDHEFEGEETGENGDGVPDADDASEGSEVTSDD